MTAAELAHFYQGLLHNPGEIWDAAPSLPMRRRNVRCNFDDPMLGVPVQRTLGLVLAGDDGKHELRYAIFGAACSPGSFGHAGANAQVAWADPATGFSFVVPQQCRRQRHDARRHSQQPPGNARLRPRARAVTHGGSCQGSCSLGHREELLVPTGAFAQLTFVEPGLGEGVRVLAVAVLRMRREELAHPVFGGRGELEVEVVVDSADRRERVGHEVGELHVDDTFRRDGPVAFVRSPNGRAPR